jgi:hypothetical protein
MLFSEIAATGRIPLTLDRNARSDRAKVVAVEKALAAFEEQLEGAKDGSEEEAAGTRLVKQLRAVFSKDGAGQDSAGEAV